MSGPTTAIIVADPIAVMLSATAIRAAQAIADGYVNAANLRDEQRANQERLRNELRNATAKGREALLQEVQAANAEFDALARLAQRYVTLDKVTATRPAQPGNNDELQLATYVRAMKALIGELRSILLTESALRMDDLGREVTLDKAIAQAAETGSKTSVQRLLARIAHLGELPQDIASVTKEIADAPFADTERAQLLTTELRMRIQKRVETVQAQAVQEASALVLEQSLKDMGYQVEEVSSTLFVEGGVVHFRRQGWDKHMVRMRVDAKTGTANFNVIRAVEQADNERSVLDHLAEDRWCAEFPALLQALDVRGIHLNVTRRLEAGELPVQLVQKDKLPWFADEEEADRSNKLQTREIK
jgi:DNA-binding transcriptional regulator YbjK